MADLLEKYYRDELALINHHLALVPDGFPEEDIHRVRVGIKKIRAVHRMLGASFPDKYSAKALNRLYKRIFRSFGKFREVQINLALLKKYGSSRKFRKSYLKYLESDLDIMKGDILIAISSFIEGQGGVDIIEELGAISADSEIKILQSYIEYQRFRAVKLLSERNSNLELHSVRIILKNIKPFLKLLARQDQSTFTRKDFLRLNRVESKIGVWHDRIMLSELLRKFIEDSPENPELVKSYLRITRRLNRRDNQRHMKRLASDIFCCLDSLNRSV